MSHLIWVISFSRSEVGNEGNEVIILHIFHNSSLLLTFNTSPLYFIPDSYYTQEIRNTKLEESHHKGEQLPFTYSPSKRLFSLLRIEPFHLHTDSNPLFSSFRYLSCNIPPSPHYFLSPQKIIHIFMRGSALPILQRMCKLQKQSAGIGMLAPPCSSCMTLSPLLTLDVDQFDL